MEEKEKKVLKFLQEWAESYFKSRDAFKKEIVSIAPDDSGLQITYKNRKEKIIVLSDLTGIKDITLFDVSGVITLNDAVNVTYLAGNWSKLIGYSELKIYFINPFSLTDKKWIIGPHIHNKICDPSSLKTGLTAMYETVEPLTKEALEAKL